METFIFSFLLLYLVLPIQCLHNISKRFLIFPQAAPTRTQFIAGIGIPVDLENESITTGVVLKSQFLLPYNVTQLRYSMTIAGLPITRSSRRRKQRNLNTRVLTYKVIERVLNKLGYDGMDCVLNTICELAQRPFSTSSGLMAELLHIVFTPSSSTFELKFRSLHNYLKAEESGRIGDPCYLQYPRCKFPLIDTISRIL